MSSMNNEEDENYMNSNPLYSKNNFIKYSDQIKKIKNKNLFNSNGKRKF